jgi:hypothetical protein
MFCVRIEAVDISAVDHQSAQASTSLSAVHLVQEKVRGLTTGFISIAGTDAQLRSLAERILSVIPQPKEETRDETAVMHALPIGTPEMATQPNSEPVGSL